MASTTGRSGIKPRGAPIDVARLGHVRLYLCFDVSVEIEANTRLMVLDVVRNEEGDGERCDCEEKKYWDTYKDD